MRDNATLQKNVQDAIKWEPLLHAAEIGVTAKDGIVTLTGVVDNYLKKSEAESAAKSVAGVKAVVEKIEVKYASNWAKKDDTEIATDVVNALKRNYQIPLDRVQVKVEKGWVTLDGNLPWNTQRVAAKNAVSHLTGVMGVIDNIKIKADSHDTIEQKYVEAALDRSWSLNADDITVKVSGTKVTLTGTVSSLYQKDEAARIAWNTPGVWHIDNELVVEYNYSLVD